MTVKQNDNETMTSPMTMKRNDNEIMTSPITMRRNDNDKKWQWNNDISNENKK